MWRSKLFLIPARCRRQNIPAWTIRMWRACALTKRAGELDLHPARHRLANLVVVVARGQSGAAPTSSLQFRHCDETFERGLRDPAVPVVRTSVRVDAGSRAATAVLPALVSPARLRSASPRARARAGRIRCRDRVVARATRRPRLRPSVCDRRCRARPGVAGGQGHGQGRSERPSPGCSTRLVHSRPSAQNDRYVELGRVEAREVR